jgi:hypothetical protein
VLTRQATVIRFAPVIGFVLVHSYLLVSVIMRSYRIITGIPSQYNRGDSSYV